MAVIGIMDSGLGGLSVYRQIRKLLPGARYFYYSDAANCPYGRRSPEFILERCKFITQSFLDKGIDVMVIACNTATAAAIKNLRESFSIPFIGMEPAVKPAALGTRNGVIGVLATEGTLKASKYLLTKGRFEDSVTILEHEGTGFVELVESGRFDGPETESVVRASLQPLLDEGADTIVLGCTHYPFLMPVMRRIAGDGVSFVDPAPAVARHLRTVLGEHGIPESDPCPAFEFISSDPDPKVDYRMLL